MNLMEMQRRSEIMPDIVATRLRLAQAAEAEAARKRAAMLNGADMDFADIPLGRPATFSDWLDDDNPMRDA